MVENLSLQDDGFFMESNIELTDLQLFFYDIFYNYWTHWDQIRISDYFVAIWQPFSPCRSLFKHMIRTTDKNYQSNIFTRKYCLLVMRKYFHPLEMPIYLTFTRNKRMMWKIYQYEYTVLLGLGSHALALSNAEFFWCNAVM